MSAKLLCLVTIHGIGFEQAPEGGAPGYADRLHQLLRGALGPDMLSDDPGDAHTASGRNGAVYVQSLWPTPEQPLGTPEQGLKRLGTWTSDPNAPINSSQAPLVLGNAPIAHVALVYSRLEAQGPHLGSGSVALGMAGTSFLRYTSLRGIAGMAMRDVPAVFGHHAAPSATPSLRVRTDLPHWRSPSRLPVPALRTATTGAAGNPSGLLATLDNLQNDVAVYVSRNDVRSRVRDFVTEALLRLIAREDIGAIVLNGHSNGTVIAFDVARALPPDPQRKLRWFVSAGSPLRKYSTLFNWGREVGRLYDVRGWTNFWDRSDPVADPLAPDQNWRRGDQRPEDAGRGLYYHLDAESGVHQPMSIDDRTVDNRTHGGAGGLPVHDYWDNETEFIAPLAQILRRLLPDAAQGEA